MSKHETWRTRQFWERTGGTLVEEFVAVPGNKDQGLRVIDGLIVLNEERAIHKGNAYPIKDKDVVVIQTKSGKLGLYLLGQAYFSKLLIERHEPRSIRVVAICGKSDAIMEELAKSHDVEVVVIADEQ